VKRKKDKGESLEKTKDKSKKTKVDSEEKRETRN
jgi:hypothetical protein